MASEVIKLNLIPKGEMPVFHVSQFDNGRTITCELFRGEDEYPVPNDITVELHCRKADNNIVTLPADDTSQDNVVKFTSTTQLTACHGKNLCEVVLKGDNDYLIGTLNFILEVEKDPLQGGIQSTSEIHDLYEQIEDITEEVIGDNYYNKSEVDDLLSGKADSDSVYTIDEVNTLLSGKANTSDVYTKSQTDTLLSAKADSSDVYTKAQIETKLADKASITYVDGEISAVDAVLIDMQTDIDRKADASDVYTKSQVDTALALKANASDVYTKAQVDSALALKANASDVYTKQEVDNIILDIMPVDTASGATAEFNTQIAAPLQSVIVDVVADQASGTPSPSNPLPITGYSSAIITANGDDITIAFGQTVYGGVLDVTRGKLHVTWGSVDLGTLEWSRFTGGGKICFRTSAQLDNAKKRTTSSELMGLLCTEYIEDTWVNTIDGSGPDLTIALGWNNNAYIGIYDSGKTSMTATDFQTAMDGVLLVYELDTPFDIDLTPEVISAIVGANTVSSNTGNIEVKYKTTIQDYIDSKIGG